MVEHHRMLARVERAGPFEQQVGGEQATMKTETRRSVATRLPALDGLRAVSVVAVVVYHIDDHLLPGGFLGVDLFFALSGYLVTSLLLRERERSGSIALLDFWKRRARRLWAAAWVILTIVALAGVANVWGADRQSTLPGEIFAAVAHIANYWQLAHGGYLEQFVAPSPVRHFWSLAVEEQFYFIWPLIIAGAMTLVARRNKHALWIILGALAVGSVSLGFFVSPEHAYLGTGTRIIALIIGAMLAYAWSSTPLAAPTSPLVRRVVVIWATVGALFLAVGLFVVHPHDEVLRHGGFLVVSLATTGVIAQTLIPGSTQYWLSAAPLSWVGRRSYGIYLIHWPVIVALGPGRPLWVMFAVVFPVTILASEALHRFVELPGISGAWSPRFMIRGALSLATIAVLALWVAQPDTTPTEQVGTDLAAVADPTLAPEPTPDSTTTTTTCVPVIDDQTNTQLAPADGLFDPATVTDLKDPGALTCGTQLDVLVVGDSTGRGISNGLASLKDPKLRIWDRTTLGCSLGDEDCPDFRVDWAAAATEIDPDVALLYFNPSDDIQGVDDAPFLSPEGRAQREAALHEAAEAVSSSGAAVVFVAVPRRWVLRVTSIAMVDRATVGVTRFGWRSGTTRSPRWPRNSTLPCSMSRATHAGWRTKRPPDPTACTSPVTHLSD